MPPRTTPKEARSICEQAIHQHKKVKLLYITKTQQRKMIELEPERLATTPSGSQVLVATDSKTKERLSYNLAQIERAQLI